MWDTELGGLSIHREITFRRDIHGSLRYGRKRL